LYGPPDGLQLKKPKSTLAPVILPMPMPPSSVYSGH